jgi:hypothetical protein
MFLAPSSSCPGSIFVFPHSIRKPLKVKQPSAIGYTELWVDAGAAAGTNCANADFLESIINL